MSQADLFDTTPPAPESPIEWAARLMDVPVELVKLARHVRQNGVPELEAFIASRELTVEDAAIVALLSKKGQRAMVAKGAEGMRWLARVARANGRTKRAN